MSFIISGSYTDNSFLDLFQEACIEFELDKKPLSKIAHLTRNILFSRVSLFIYVILISYASLSVLDTWGP